MLECRMKFKIGRETERNREKGEQNNCFATSIIDSGKVDITRHLPKNNYPTNLGA